MSDEVQTLTLGGGCFWCLDAVYVQVQGVLGVQSGYSNGQASRPTYAQVCTGSTGCNEVVQLRFDPAVVSARELLEIFFVIHDPTTLNQQGHDRGTQYRSGIYFSHPQHQQVAMDLVRELNDSGVYRSPVLTEVLALAHYWPAEDDHQNYFANNPTQGYCLAVAAPKVEKFRRTFARLARG